MSPVPKSLDHAAYTASFYWEMLFATYHDEPVSKEFEDAYFIFCCRVLEAHYNIAIKVCCKFNSFSDISTGFSIGLHNTFSYTWLISYRR